jgi:hypothetical protein
VPRSVTGKVSPDVRQGSHSMTWGQAPHVIHPALARSAKKVNRHTGSMQPPCGHTPFHLRRSQQSRRRTAAQEACNRPSVIRPSIFTTTNGQGDEPPQKKHATAPRLRTPSASLQPVAQPLAWGPGPTCHTSDTPVPRCRKAAPPLAPIPRLLEAVAEG